MSNIIQQLQHILEQSYYWDKVLELKPLEQTRFTVKFQVYNNQTNEYLSQEIVDDFQIYLCRKCGQDQNENIIYIYRDIDGYRQYIKQFMIDNGAVLLGDQLICNLNKMPDDIDEQLNSIISLQKKLNIFWLKIEKDKQNKEYYPQKILNIQQMKNVLEEYDHGKFVLKYGTIIYKIIFKTDGYTRLIFCDKLLPLCQFAKIQCEIVDCNHTQLGYCKYTYTINTLKQKHSNILRFSEIQEIKNKFDIEHIIDSDNQRLLIVNKQRDNTLIHLQDHGINPVQDKLPLDNNIYRVYQCSTKRDDNVV